MKQLYFRKAKYLRLLTFEGLESGVVKWRRDGKRRLPSLNCPAQAQGRLLTFNLSVWEMGIQSFPSTERFGLV